MIRADIIKLLKMVRDNYPNTKIQDAKGTVDMWELAFSEYEATDVFKAVRLHINTSKFFPTPADVLKAMPKAKIIYSDNPSVPMIEAPEEARIVPDDYMDDLLDLDIDHGHCDTCPRKAYCYSR